MNIVVISTKIEMLQVKNKFKKYINLEQYYSGSFQLIQMTLISEKDT